MGFEMAVASIVSGIADASQQRAQGRIARGEAEVSAQQAEAAGVAREADRKERLIEALASQNAYAGVGGIAAFEGSPLSVMQEDIRREGKDTERDKFQSKLEAMTLRTRGKVAEKQAKSSANIGLITSGVRTYTGYKDYNAKYGGTTKPIIDDIE